MIYPSCHNAHSNPTPPHCRYLVGAAVLLHAYSTRQRGAGTNVLKLVASLISDGSSPLRTIIADLVGVALLGALLRSLRNVLRMSYKDWKDLIGGQVISMISMIPAARRKLDAEGPKTPSLPPYCIPEMLSAKG